MSVHPAAHGLAQPVRPATPPRAEQAPFARSIDLDTITGRDFAGLRLPLTPQRGDLSIVAQRAWTWSDGGGPGGGMVDIDGLPIVTQRLALQGDVRIETGTYRFTAVQAVLWIQTVPDAGPGAVQGPPTRQVAIYFDRVSDPGAEAGFAQAADRLLVTAVLTGEIALKCESVTPGRPGAEPASGFAREGEARLSGYLRQLVDPSAPEAPVPRAPIPDVVGTPMLPGRTRVYEPNAGFAQQDAVAPEAAQAPVEPLFARDGVVTFAVGTSLPTGPTAPAFNEPPGDTDTVRIIRGENDNAVVLTGGVAVQYADVRRSRNLQITAERAVVFLEPGPLTQLAQFSADQVRGVYLEGDAVATDGRYTLRGPRVYYDFKQNKAVMAEAVFTTFDARMNVPVYIRAQSLRQEAANQFAAENARLSTSSFFTPMLSIGAKTVTVNQRPVARGPAGPGELADDQTGESTYVSARGVTLRAGGLPFMWLPGYQGTLEDIPLKDIRVENSSSSGGAVKTSWNAFGLFGVERPEGVELDLLIDGYFDRGFAGGTKVRWKRDDHDGQLFLYGLPSDQGRDVLSSGARRDGEDKFRGLLLAEDTWEIDDNWTLQLELASQSDPRFVDAFFKDISKEGRELASSAFLKYVEDNQLLSVLVKGNLNNYVPNHYILQSRGYVVEKAPEVAYTRLADDLFRGVSPGLITWNHDYRFSRMKFDFIEPSLRDLGFDTVEQSQLFTGLGPDVGYGDAFRAIGLRETDVLRFDTRQELTATLDLAPFKVTPFVTGRFTGYDKTFGEIYGFQNLLPGPAFDSEDQYRAWCAAGARVSTEIVRVDDSVESSLFDLHRVRHVVEPNMTVWTGASNIRTESLPFEFDRGVESINQGSAVRAGVRQTWQTKRGGPGRWHSVDVFKLNTDFVFSTRDTDVRSPIGRFFDYRPEYSFLGDYFTADAAWQLTDTVALSGSTIYDFDLHQPQRSTAGGLIQHSEDFSSFAQVRYLNPVNATYVDFGGQYRLTRLYSLAAVAVLDTDEGEIQTIDATLRRRFPEATLGVSVGYSTITDETSLSVVFEPQAAGNLAARERVQRLRDIGR